MTWSSPYANAPVDMIKSLAGPVTLDAAGYPIEIDLDVEHITRVYLPLLDVFADVSRSRRVVAGLAGVPGGGKSMFCSVLAHVADRVLGPGVLVHVAMDGWHWPNRILDERTTTDAAGQTIPLRQRKGGPESFDVSSLATAIAELQDATHPVALPVYDRRLHEPVSAGLTVEPRTRIVLPEGNFLLSVESPWDTVSRLLQPKLFLDCDADAARERVIARHIRGGCTPEQAACKYAINDQLNTELVQATAAQADFIIRPDAAPPEVVSRSP